MLGHKFSLVPQADIPRSSFDRSSSVKTTFNGGYLVPIFLDEVVPGDTFNLRTAGFARLSTPIFPLMDQMYMDTFYFFVPFRLLWPNFLKMCGEQTDPGDSTDYSTPQLVSDSSSGWAELSLGDYFGIPTKIKSLSHSALPFRAYNLVFNDWFRDQNLQNSLTVQTDDGPDVLSNYSLQRRGRRHDYFTSCLPWPQKGVAVDVPIGTSAPIRGIGTTSNSFPTSGASVYESGASATRTYTHATASTGALTLLMEEDPANPGFPSAYVDLSSAEAATINQLRQAFQIQKMYERDARGGTRYIEIIKSHFGVTSDDARLQRPEFLGGSSAPVNITPIPSNTDLRGDNASLLGVGDLGAMGITSFRGAGFTKSFTEHGIVLGLVSVRADLSYQQGLNRMWSRSDRFDYLWPALTHIGEQAVLNQEIYAQDGASASQNSDVFGYQERYAEYRYKPSIVTGEFRSNATTPLDSWHLALDFSSLPVLNGTFIQDQPPIARVVAIDSKPQFIADFFHNLICARPLPMYGVPGNIDRF